MGKRLEIFFLGAGIFLLFIFFSYLVAKELFLQLDFDTTVRLQDNIPRKLDDALSLLSEFGSFEVLTVVLILLIVLWRKIRGALFFFSYILFHFIELYGKFFVAHAPPPEFMLRTKRIFEFPQFHVRAENSYPSGHVGRTVFLTIVLIGIILASKKISGSAKLVLVSLILIFDLAMIVSRVYLGEHWVSDVIGGVLLGAGLAITTYAITK